VLDRYSLVPLHHQLRAAIRERVDSGQWPPRGQLPSERELCELFQVSRITVRHAISQLVAEGHLVRKRGSGTYVAPSPFRKCLLPLMGFTEEMRARGQRPGARVLKFEEVAAEARVADALQLGKGERVVLLKRLRLANDEPMALETH
jgi:GntR family transcriptional regulator